MAVDQPAHLLAVVKACNGFGTRCTKKSHAAWRAMLVAKLASPSDTARQWSNFAPQKQRCLHGQGRRPLKTLLDAGNEVAEDQSEEDQVMEDFDWAH